MSKEHGVNQSEQNGEKKNFFRTTQEAVKKVPEKVLFFVSKARELVKTNPMEGLKELTNLTEVDPQSRKLEEVKNIQNPDVFHTPQYILWAGQERNMPKDRFNRLLDEQLPPGEQGWYAEQFARDYPQVYAESARSGIVYKRESNGDLVPDPDHDPELNRIHYAAQQRGFEEEHLYSFDQKIALGQRYEAQMINDWVREMTPEKASAYARMHQGINEQYNRIADQSQNIFARLLSDEPSPVVEKVALRANEPIAARERIEANIPAEVSRNLPLLDVYAETIPVAVREAVPALDTQAGVMEAMNLLQNAYRVRDENRGMIEADNPSLREANAIIHEVTRRVLEGIRERGNNEGTALASAFLDRAHGISVDEWRYLMLNEQMATRYMTDIRNTRRGQTVDFSRGRRALLEEVRDIRRSDVRDRVAANVNGLFRNSIDRTDDLLESIADRMWRGYRVYTGAAQSIYEYSQAVPHANSSDSEQSFLGDDLNDLLRGL